MQLHRDRQAFDEQGVQVVVIGHSSLRYAQAFVEETGIEFPVFVDEKRAIYKELGFKRPLLAFLTPKVLKRGAEARKAGFTQAGVHGDAFQLGGVLLLMPDGSKPYTYASQFAGDHPRIEDLKAAVRAAKGAS